MTTVGRRGAILKLGVDYEERTDWSSLSPFSQVSPNNWRNSSNLEKPHLVLLGGEAVLFVERGRRSLRPLCDPNESWLRPALTALVSHVRRREIKLLAVERFDGQPVISSDAMPLFIEAGFTAGPRRAVLPA